MQIVFTVSRHNSNKNKTTYESNYFSPPYKEKGKLRGGFMNGVMLGRDCDVNSCTGGEPATADVESTQFRWWIHKR